MKKPIKINVIGFFLCTILLFLTYKRTGQYGGNSLQLTNSDSVTWNEALHHLPQILVMSFIFMAVAYFLEIKMKNNKK